MQEGREETHGHLLERPFLGDEDTEGGVVLVLEVPDLREDFLVCSCLDRRLGEEEVGGERERFLVWPSLEQSMAQGRPGAEGPEGVQAPGGFCCSITCTVRKIAARSLVWGRKEAGKISSVRTVVEGTLGEEPSTAVEGAASPMEGTASTAGGTSVSWAGESFETSGTGVGQGVKLSAIAVEVTGATEGGASWDWEVWVIWDMTALRASTRGMRSLWWRTKILFSAIYLGQLDEDAAWGVLQWKQRGSREQVLGLWLSERGRLQRPHTACLLLQARCEWP